LAHPLLLGDEGDMLDIAAALEKIFENHKDLL
jgi:hypothetical protein